MSDREREEALLLDLISATDRYNSSRAEVERVYYSSNAPMSSDRQHRARVAANAQDAQREVIVEVFRKIAVLAQAESRPVEQERSKAAGSSYAEG